MSEGNGNGKAVTISAGGSPRPIVPTSFEEVQRIAAMVVSAGMFKATDKNQAVAQATMALMQGLEIGISPMQAANGIAIINGRPCIWGSLVPALIWKAGHKIEEWIEGEDMEAVAHCKITRSDNNIEIERTFSMKDAKRAGLLEKPGPWKQYPRRMLGMRARGFAANDGVPDVLRGMYTVEEMQDVAEDRGALAEAPAMPPPPPLADPLDEDAAFLKEATQDTGQISEADAAASMKLAMEDVTFVGEALARFQSAVDNASEADEVLSLFERFEEETDGRLPGAMRAHAVSIMESRVEALTP